MTRRGAPWDFGDFFQANYGVGFHSNRWRRRGGLFESGDMKFVIDRKSTRLNSSHRL